MRKGPVVLTAVLAIAYAAFWVWYGGSGKPMGQAEIDRRIADIEASTVAKGKTVDRHLIDSMRTLAASDDGDEFFMINLIRYREKALYPPELQKIYGDDARAADARYTEKIIPLLLKHGNIPVMAGETEGRFLHPDNATDWHVAAAVRYRSRRDLLKMVQEMNAAPFEVGIHKWASIERTQVFPVKPKFSFIMVRLTVFVGFAGLGLLLHLLLSLVPAYRRR